MHELYNEQQLESLTNKFVADVLGKENPEGVCFTICYPLCLLLKTKHIETVIVSGYLNDTPHYVLKTTGVDELIIDPTIKQFGNEYPYVYSGRAEEYKNFHPIDFNMVFDAWIDPLLNDGIRYAAITTGPEKLGIDLTTFLQLNLRAANVLLNEIDWSKFQQTEHSTYMLKKYIEAVKTIMQNNSEKKEVIAYSKPGNNLNELIGIAELRLNSILN